MSSLAASYGYIAALQDGLRVFGSSFLTGKSIDTFSKIPYSGTDGAISARNLAYNFGPKSTREQYEKFLKKVNLTTFDGAESTVVLNWAFDYTNAYKKQAYTLPANNAAQYNISEYNTTAEYASSLSLINRQKVNASGSGSVVSIGVESTVNGKSIAIQQLNVHALLGRVV